MREGFYRLAAIALAASCCTNALAFTFELDDGAIKGALDSQLTAGFGLRLRNQDCSIIGTDTQVCPKGGNPIWTGGDNGDQNYKAGEFFAGYIKGTHELLLEDPADRVKFLGRTTWLIDAAASHTDVTPLAPDARDQVTRDIRLLDLWVSKDFTLNGEQARIRGGNQVQNWGESVFTPGGVNATFALDTQKLAVPGTQLKEAVLPAPMLSVGTGLGHGIHFDSYVQFQWQRNRIPPVGTYFSTSDFVGRGRLPSENAGAIPPDVVPRDMGQYGVAMHYKPDIVQADFGVYVVNYHEKNYAFNYTASGPLQLVFPEDRILYGISTNTQFGDFQVGAEFTYRPKDAIALSGCFVPNATGSLVGATPLAINCPGYIDTNKNELILNTQYAVQPGNIGAVLNVLGAQTATLTAELAVVNYPGIDGSKRYYRNVNGTRVMQAVDAGYGGFLDAKGNLIPTASAYSVGTTVDFNWVYDNVLIPGWQVNPGATTFVGTGDSPYISPYWLARVKSINYYVNFTQNPPKWNAGLNITQYWGDPIRQGYRDRTFLGGYVTRNF
jgi:Protein of unknown function (DUF1302)